MMWNSIPLHGPPSCPAIILFHGAYNKPKYYQMYPTLQASIRTYFYDPAATLESST